VNQALLLIGTILFVLVLLDFAADRWGVDSRRDPSERPDWW
jgi:hypothetical protein